MKKDKNPSADAAELRRRAEKRLREAATEETPGSTEADARRLLQELQIHQVELEMQNEDLVQAQAGLEEALGKYTDLYEFAPVGYVTLGREGAIRQVNLTGARLLGVERGRLVGRRFELFVHQSDRRVFNAFLEKVVATRVKAVCEVALPTKGEPPLNVQITAEVSQDGQLCRVMMVDISARRQAEEALLKANAEMEQKVSERTFELAVKIDELKLANEELESRTKRLRLLAGELTRAEQHERKRLSQLLHDGLQQHLLSAKMRLGGIAELVGDVERMQATNEIEQIISESVQLSRSLSAELSPPILHEAGLLAGLEWLVRWMRVKHKFSVNLSIEAQPELPEDAKILVFESVRELLFNAVKHSKVHSARVNINQANGTELQIAISDEGAGFDPRQLKPPGEEGGFGLFSLRERMGLIGGRVEIDSAPGKGSRFTLIVPVREVSTLPLCAGPKPSMTGSGTKKSAAEPGGVIRVLLADDHTLFADGLARMLKKQKDLKVVGHAVDGQEAIDQAGKVKPDVILMDIGMPRVNGIEATRIIHREYPDIRIIGLSMYEDQERAQAMMEAGAAGYKTKGCAASELVSAIRGCV
jgi:PAS domain S-box-containing protein